MNLFGTVGNTPIKTNLGKDLPKTTINNRILFYFYLWLHSFYYSIRIWCIFWGRYFHLMHCSFCYSNRTWMYFRREVFPSYVSFFDIFENSLLGNITPLPPPPPPPIIGKTQNHLRRTHCEWKKLASIKHSFYPPSLESRGKFISTLLNVAGFGELFLWRGHLMVEGG